MIDISNEHTLVEYLKLKRLLNDKSKCNIHYCKGGVSCTVAYVCIDEKPIIVKQALSKLKTKDDWQCDPNRMNIEFESNRIYHNLLPSNVPETYFYDSENYIYGREAVPDGCLMWKDYLMNGILSYPVARETIDTLSTVHNKCANDEKIKQTFKNKDVFYNLRISPYFEFTAEKHPEIKDLSKKISDEMMESEISLIHGDYSPKNIMVIDNGISVLDYEVSCFGHPAFDLAFFANHFILKAVKFKEFSCGYLCMLDFMIKRYFENLKYMDKKEFERTFIETLSLLLLARVDGKSPVEYLVGDDTKQDIVRKISFKLIKNNVSTFADAKSLIEKILL